MTCITVGCAGWNLRKEFKEHFPSSGTHLRRYAARFNGVEINSSFYRPHRTLTYKRWADATPPDFLFSVKVPKQITHACRLVNAEAHIEQFAIEVSGLGGKLGALLVQLPPSLSFDNGIAENFFRALGSRLNAPIVCEPRHISWFEPDAESLMWELGIDRVAADPSISPEAGVPGGRMRTIYFRWHGSPRMYYSSYDERALADLSCRLLAAQEWR